MPIHSGQFMVMSLSDNEDDKPKPHKKRSLKYWSIRASTKKSIHRSANRNVDGTASLTRTGSDSSIHVDNDKIDFSIEKLTKSLQLFQNNYKPSNENIENLVMSPKWNNFLGTSFNVRRIIRLNNIIWREWFRQNQLKLKPRVCKFVNQLNRKECSFYLGKHQFLQKLMYVPREYRYFRLLYLQKHCIETQKLSYSPIALWNPRSIICRDQDTRQEEINSENGTDNYWDMNNYHHYAFQASPAQQLNKLSSAYAHTRPLYENPNDQNSNPMEMYQHDYLDNYQYTQKNNFYMQDALQHHFSTFPTSNYSSNPNLSEYDVNSNLIHDDLNSFSNLNYNIKSVNTHFNCQFQQKPQLHNYSKYYKINYDCVIDAMNKNKRIKVENEKTEFQNVSIGDTEFKKSFQNYVNFYEKKATSQCDENKFYNQYMAKNKNKSNNLLNTPGRFTQDKPIKKFHSPLQNSESDFSGIGDIKLNTSSVKHEVARRCKEKEILSKLKDIVPTLANDRKYSVSVILSGTADYLVDLEKEVDMYNKTIQNKKRECDILLDKLKYPDETDSEVNVNHLLSNHEKMKLMQLFDNYVVDKLKINRNRRIDSVEDKLQQIDQDKKNKIFSYVFKPLYSTVVNSVSKYNKESFMNSLKMVPENQALMAKIRADTIDAVLDLSESDIFDV